jgi:CheY-like chemotaxis protein
VPAIALTAFITPELRRRTIEAGFQIHLAKPSSPEEIIDAVRSLLVSEVP